MLARRLRTANRLELNVTVSRSHSGSLTDTAANRKGGLQYGKNERHSYLKAIRPRYRRAGKKARATLLDEFCAVCGYHRKQAIRLLNQSGKPGQ